MTNAPEVTMKDLMDAVTSEQIDDTRARVQTAFAARMQFEHRLRPNNETIQSKLAMGVKRLTTHFALQGLTALHVDPEFVNRELTEGKRYNVYAVPKVYDLLSGITAGRLENAINIAVMKSMFRFRAAGVPFTGEIALAAASDKIKVASSLNQLLVRYTVSANTAPTQISSTLNAMGTLGLAVNRGNQKFPIYELLDSPQLRALEKICA